MVAIVKKHRERKAEAALKAVKLVETPTDGKKGIHTLGSPLI